MSPPRRRLRLWLVSLALAAGCREEQGRCSDSERPCVQLEREDGAASLVIPDGLQLIATRTGAAPTPLAAQHSGVEAAFRERGHYTLELDTAPERLALHADALRDGAAVLSGDVTYEPGVSPRPLPLRLRPPVLSDQPFISAILPASGPTSGGTQVQLVGGGFRNSPMLRVLFGDTEAALPGFVDVATLKPTSPAGKFGSVPVVVETAPGVRSAPVSFRYYCGSVAFRVGAGYTVTQTDRPLAVATGDINGDGLLDAVVAVGGGNEGPVVIYQGKRDPTYRLSYLGAPSTGAAAIAVVVARIDGDALDDVVALESAAVRVMLQKAGTIEAVGRRTPVTLASGVPTLTALAVDDLDGDGKKDVAITASLGPNSDGKLVVLYGDGGGGFRAPLELSVGRDPQAVAVLKLDGDNRPDLVVANKASGTLSVILGKPDGTLGAVNQQQAGLLSPVHLSTGHLNEDDREDLLLSGQTVSNQPAVAVLINNGSGRFPIDALPLSLTPAGSFAAAADMDGDGKSDVVSYGAAGSTLAVWRGQGDGKSFAMSFQQVQSGLSALVVRDMDADQHPDLLLLSADRRSLTLLYQSCP